MRMKSVFLGLVAFNLAAFAHVEPARFSEWLDAAEHGGAPLPEAVRAKAAGFRYVFVNGIANEIAKFHAAFLDNEAELRRLGVPDESMHIVNPSSLRSVAGNVDFLQEQIASFAAQGPQKLVLIGHSKGSTELLAWALSAPPALLDQVQAIFLVQGPFRGTPIADLGQKFLAPDHPEWVDGVLSLTPKVMQALWTGQLAKHAETAAALSNRLYYVTSADTFEHMPKDLKGGAFYLNYIARAGANDGVIPVANQSLEQLGTKLVQLPTSHEGTMDTIDKTDEGVKFRKALTQALCQAAAAQD